VFYADGEQANAWDYQQFTGFETTDFLPSDMPTGLSWLAHETGRWIREHASLGESGPVQVQYGFIQYSMGANGRVDEEVVILSRGTARKQ
jgi:hypothetical protein